MTFAETPLYDFRISDGLAPVSGVGECDVVTGYLTMLVGSLSDFGNECHVGDLVVANGQTREIAAIADSSHLTVRTAFAAPFSLTTYQIIVLVNVESLATPLPAPKAPFEPYMVAYETGDAGKRGYGQPTCTWHFGFLTNAQRDMLRTYCPGASATIYIRTMTNESSDAYQTYTAKMLWPDKEPRDFHHRVPFDLIFRDLVLP